MGSTSSSMSYGLGIPILCLPLSSGSFHVMVYAKVNTPLPARFWVCVSNTDALSFHDLCVFSFFIMSMKYVSQKIALEV